MKERITTKVNYLVGFLSVVDSHLSSHQQDNIMSKGRTAEGGKATHDGQDSIKGGGSFESRIGLSFVRVSSGWQEVF
jgi:hypothetical protein